jgi:hypothetical protein
MTQILYTSQAPGHDITKPWVASPEYGAGGAYESLVEYLGYAPWVWCLQHTEDYFNDWFVVEHMQGKSLWVLSVPSDCVLWLSLDAQCENVTPVPIWFSPTPDEIRARSETPQAIIRAPVAADWVLSVHELAVTP